MTEVTGIFIAAHDESRKLTLLQVLSNSLILYHTVPLLPISSLLALGAACRDLRAVVHHTPQVFRYLNLGHVKSLQFKKSHDLNETETDRHLTEDEVYAGSLRGAFRILARRHILQDVQILILDGLSVTSELVTEIMLAPQYNVRILSIREAQNLNEGKLMQALEYSVRLGRAPGTPRVQGLYIFGKKDTTTQWTTSPRADRSTLTQLVQNCNSSQRESEEIPLDAKSAHLYGSNGVMLEGEPIRGWPETILACRGLISFDAVLCTGPRHTLVFNSRIMDPDQKHWYAQDEFRLSPAIATISVNGCQTCHAAPEGIASSEDLAGERFPLLAPPPMYSPTIRASKRLSSTKNSEKLLLLARCGLCLAGRYCEGCRKWWCEDCYEIPIERSSRHSFTSPPINPELGGKFFKPGVWRECRECGFNCGECIAWSQRICTVCTGGYCMIHNEGSNLTLCDCAIPGAQGQAAELESYTEVC